ncbi:hypothetical protein Bcell_0386 [Evansella cellulosilytica DSM 2522]|uniref:Uncharacterized protein n=1 Tax=Evansella cellulosilytica (strain ATCC 21833 / DSM 2522 / FERM P-1141 / JCM 9156 / N-4) TaxID=649639 RepID=E6TVV9_EVAC2|nr:hypothetical protein Bcell_0386 [Evansella cellulosilytica DSM 2522]
MSVSFIKDLLFLSRSRKIIIDYKTFYNKFSLLMAF